VRVEGQENIPREGPLLIVANHAGGIDFLAVMASITRPDLRMVANVHRVLQGVTHAAPHMLFTDNRPEARLSVILSVVAALKNGDAVLIFPSGLLEPDPALIPGAKEYMRRSWSPSLGVFLSKVPEARLLPVLVGGVVSPRAYNSLPARLRRTTKVRQKTALLMQYMAYMNLSQRWPAEVRVVISSPCTLDELNPLGEPRQWLDAILHKEQSLMAHHYPQSDRPLVNWDR